MQILKKHIILLLGMILSTPMLTLAQTIDTVCAGETGAYYEVDNTTGSNYFWNVEGATDVIADGRYFITVDWGNDPGLYPIEVTETSSEGCVGEPQRAYVMVVAPPNAEIMGPNQVCFGDEIALSIISANSAIWNTGEKGQKIHVRPLNDKIFWAYIEEYGCSSDTANKYVAVNEAPQVDFKINPVNPKEDDPIRFIPQGPDLRKFYWNLDTNSTVISNARIPSITFASPGKKVAVLIATDNNKCFTKVTREFYVAEKGNKVLIAHPNTFTPNGDGNNDYFEIQANEEIQKFELQIFNRWGERVFVSNNLENQWDGTFKGEPVKLGAYILQINAVIGGYPVNEKSVLNVVY
ncbi:MAG: gliding motility-associated-like protein [Sphingobacteriales bacterium]|jgi:gliding motility-associated-like protein